MIGALFSALIALVILGLIFWLITYLMGLFPLPEPFPRAIQALFAIIAVLVVISVLLGWDAGLPVLRWRY